MLIDWFTVGAQVLNFVILVWLMKRFLYKPILDAIDAREKLIAAELADAAASKAEAEKESTDFRKRNEDFDQKRSALFTQATDDAKAERLRLETDARTAAEAMSAKLQKKLERESLDLSRAIGRRTRDEVFAIARRVLTDLATIDLEASMSQVFTRRLRDMDDQTRGRLGEALKSAVEPALVRSAFELPAKQQAAIQNAITESFSAEIEVRFEVAADLIGGIELSANGQKVAWNIDDYLGALETSVGEILVKQGSSRPETASGPGSVHGGTTIEPSA
ncbi:MAG: F0F1 ATP synthase subunit delta [Planctomycetes bacterium]|nr:F0F1 ATP synthase subunit delta [Planctomycetota bacterium]